MKTKLKALTLVTALSTVGLCFTISHASANVSDHELDKYKFVIVNKLKTYTKNEDIDPTALFTTESFVQMFDKPLVKIPLDVKPISDFKKPVKKNEFFELATVFNDKLQQLISTFSSHSVEKNNKQLMSKTKLTKTCNAKT